MNYVRRALDFREDRNQWRARVWPPDGGVVSKYFAKTQKRAAQSWIDENVATISSGMWVDPDKGRMRFGAYAENEFFPHDDARSAEGRRFNYDNHVKPRWENVALEDITKADVVKWVTELKTRPKVRGDGPLGGSTVRQVYFAFTKIIRDAFDKEFLSRLPLPKAPNLPDGSPQKRVIPLEPFEVERLACDIKDVARDMKMRWTDTIIVPDFPLANYVLLHLLTAGGFRIGEGTALRVNDLNFESNTVLVDEQLHVRRDFTPYVKGSKDTGRKYRSVPISRRVMVLVQEHIEKNLPDHRGSTLLFTTPIGTPLRSDNWRARYFTPAIKQSGLQGFTPHHLRHTAASAWYDEGYDLEMIAVFLGDTIEVVRETYWHIFEHRRDPRQDRMDARFDRGQAEVDGDVIDMARRRRA